MLAITDNAARAILAIISANQVPEGAGLRIGAESSDGQNVSLGLSLVSGPSETDQVVEHAGAQVFVGAEAAALLDDKMLDAHAEGEQIAFSVIEQR
jgi:Fe-S cluster assembly iron-binding protein IscA